MLGAIFGDIVGSHYEFDPTNVYHSMLELPQDIDLEHPVRTIDLTEYLK